MDSKGYHYKGFVIEMNEAIEYSTYTYKGPQAYTVSTGAGKLVFRASCEFGVAYAVKPEDALDMAKILIDDYEKAKITGN